MIIILRPAPGSHRVARRSTATQVHRERETTMAAESTSSTGSPATEARRVEKPWGYEIIWAHTGRYCGKILHIHAGQALSYQFHRVKEETVYVLSGTLRLHWSQDDSPARVEEFTAGSGFHVRPGLRHRFEAVGDVDLLEASTPELDDVVRLDDRYGRTGRTDG